MVKVETGKVVANVVAEESALDDNVWIEKDNDGVITDERNIGENLEIKNLHVIIDNVKGIRNCIGNQKVVITKKVIGV